MNNECKYLYRFEQDCDGSLAVLVLRKYKILKKTRCGFWIFREFKKDRFVNLKCKKQYASKTKKEALEQFIFRTLSYIEILSRQKNNANISLKIAIGISKTNKIEDLSCVSYNSFNF